MMTSIDYRSMPRDLNELYGDLARADEDGNKEVASIIAKRINMLKSAGYERDDSGETVARNPIKDDSGLTKFRVGMGRGFMDLAQGAKQKGLMVGESLGLVDEGRADEYTQQMQDEIGQFEQDYPGIGPESVGRFAGWATPALATGGLAGSSVPAAMGVGAVEGALAPSPDASYEDMILQSLVGAAAGGAGAAAPKIISGIAGKVGPKAVKNIDPDMAVAVKETGIKLTPDQYNDNLMNRVAGKAMPQRSSKMSEADAALEKIHTAWKSEDPGLQQTFNAGKQRLMDADSQAFEAMWDAKVASNKMVPVGDYRISMKRFADNIQDQAKKFVESGLGEADAASMMSILDQMPAPANGKFLTLRELHQFRQKVWQADGLSKDAKTATYRLISDEMRNAAKINGGDAALDMMNNRISSSQDVYNTLESAGIPNKYVVQKSGQKPKKTSDKPFTNALFSGDSGRKAAIREVIGQTEGGMQRVRNDLMDYVMEDMDSMTPSQIATRLKKVTSAAEGVLPDDEVALLRGMRKIMNTIPREADLSDKVVRAGAAVGPTIAASMANPVAGLATAGGMGVLRAAMNKRNVRDALMKASTMDDPQAISKIANYIYGSTLAGSGVATGQEIY